MGDTEVVRERFDNLITTVNRLQDVLLAIHGSQPTSGVMSTLNIPQIAVVGAQSTGKSSVIEALVGRAFIPRGNGIVTRCPLILQLVQLRYQTDEEWGEFAHLRAQRFDSFADIHNEIIQATNERCGEHGVSNIPIRLSIHSPNVIDLTLIDLPGLTKVPVLGQPEDIEMQVRSMVSSYIKESNCIILAVTPGNTDLATSDSLNIAKEVDPDGRRTIGVITKVDLIVPVNKAMDAMRGIKYHLKLGYVGVVSRSAESTLSLMEATKMEDEFFRSQQKYNREIATRCGTKYLARRLNKILLYHIKACLPGLQDTINKLITECEHKMLSLGAPVIDPTGFLLNLCTKFSENFNEAIKGGFSHNSVLYLSNQYSQVRPLKRPSQPLSTNKQKQPQLSHSPHSTSQRESVAHRSNRSLHSKNHRVSEAEAFLSDTSRTRPSSLAQTPREVSHESLPSSQGHLTQLPSEGHLTHLPSEDHLTHLNPQHEKEFNEVSVFSESVDSPLRGKLVGGARILHVFNGWFEQELSKIDPLLGLHNNEKVWNEILNATGVTVPVFLPHIAFENIVKTQIKQLERPSLECADHVGQELHDIGRDCEPIEFTRFPQLREKLSEVVSGLLKGCLQPAKDHIRNVIAAEIGFINASHPDIHETRVLHEALNSGGAKLESRQECSVNLIRELVKVYFLVVRKTVCDCVPKAIMHFMVNASRQQMNQRLVEEVVIKSKDEIPQMMVESPHVEDERRRCSSLLKALRESVSILEDINNADEPIQINGDAGGAQAVFSGVELLGSRTSPLLYSSSPQSRHQSRPHSPPTKIEV
eukprot:GHVN01107400.1.p1 GENE.GHVN01107400.1~~GHVN01107400.1.p1  ORF type:complete len:813 (+),score=167.21 GHVN01107400.1:53-2491(+)